MQFPPFPRYLVPPRSKYSPQHHVLKHPQLPFLSQSQRPSFTPIQNNRQSKGFTSTYHNVWNEIRKHGKRLYIKRGVRRGNHCIYLHLLCLRHLRGSGVMKPRRSPTDSPRGEVTQREKKEGWVDSTRPPADLTKWVDRRGITGLTRQGRAAYRSVRTSWSGYQQANSFDWSHVNSWMWFVSFLLKLNGTGFVVSGRYIIKLSILC